MNRNDFKKVSLFMTKDAMKPNVLKSIRGGFDTITEMGGAVVGGACCICSPNLSATGLGATERAKR